MNRWPLAVTAALTSATSVTCFTSTLSQIICTNNLQHFRARITPSTTTHLFLSSSASLSSSQSSPPLPSPQNSTTETCVTTSNAYEDDLSEAIATLQKYEQSQQQFVAGDGNLGMGGGLSALRHVQSLDGPARADLQRAVLTLSAVAHAQRAKDSSRGRIMLGFCASNAPEALAGLKSWVQAVNLPRGMLHGMDVDGVPIPVEDLGAVYVKYSTGGAMTFAELRRSGRGFDALWRPGDAVLEGYDGDFRGIYYSVELGDDSFYQFGVLPTDLFLEEEEDW